MGLIDLTISNPVLGPLYALAAGVLTSISPCGIAAIPLIVGHMAGASRQSRARDLTLFLAGMAMSLTAVGVVAAVLGRSLILSAPWLRWMAGAAFVLGGLSYMEIVGASKTCRVRLPAEPPAQAGSAVASFGTGALYGFSASPCTTPALLAILGLVASSGSVFKGVMLIVAYSIGQSFPVALAGLATSKFRAFLEDEKNLRALEYVRKTGGAIIVLFGLYVMLRPYLQ